MQIVAYKFLGWHAILVCALVMVIELTGVQFGLKSYAWFQNQMSTQRKLIWNHKYDFRPKLHDPKFNCHFITSILKSHNLIAQIQTRRFWSVPLYIEPVAGLSKSEIRNVFTSHFENMSGSCQRDVIASCDWLFCFTVLFSLAEKKLRFRGKKSVICE